MGPMMREEQGFCRMPSISRHSRARILSRGIKLGNQHFTGICNEKTTQTHNKQHTPPHAHTQQW